MLDIKRVREQPEVFKAGLRKRGRDPKLIDDLVLVDVRRRQLLAEIEGHRARQNKASAEIPRLTGQEREVRIAQMREISAALKALEPELAQVESSLDLLLRALPNQPDDSVPEGADASHNVVLRTWGEPPAFDFPPLDHVDLATRLGLIDFERGAKVSGSRFYYLRGDGVLLEAALVRLALDLLAREGGFTLISPPVLVRTGVITGAWGGVSFDPQQTYKVEDDDLALIATSEQSLAAYHQDEVLDGAALPRRYGGLSYCFRREAGSYGRDIRGLYRVHQFYKVELFSFVRPERSAEEHEYLVELEERFMQTLGLPYRVVVLCGGDLGQAMTKTYDIETWMPGRGGYGETHSCSNAGDYQARRLGIKYREAPGGAAAFVHTLNGTLVAPGRLFIALLENGQQADGRVRLPEALAPYLGGRSELRPA